eukprot:scaffold93711_cov72-Phaeocystis_antarctica.AAC.1
MRDAQCEREGVAVTMKESMLSLHARRTVRDVERVWTGLATWRLPVVVGASREPENLRVSVDKLAVRCRVTRTGSVANNSRSVLEVSP